VNPVKIIGLALIVLGICLGFMGYQESQSFASQVSEAVTGSTTDRSMTFIVAGIVSLVVGLYLVLRRP
jgi:drug/metabolite transporter (DMT)-like permease